MLTALELANLWKQSNSNENNNNKAVSSPAVQQLPMPSLNLYVVMWEEESWDQYRSITVAAESEERARRIHPHLEDQEIWERGDFINAPVWVDYADIDTLDVEHIGTALPSTKEGVVSADFHNG